MPEAVLDPDDRILVEALREAGAAEKSAYTAVQEVRNMAGQNIFAAIDALNGKIDAQESRSTAKSMYREPSFERHAGCWARFWRCRRP